MTPWFLALALAAAPDGIDPDDFGHWEAAADRALDGPAGCWDLTGAVRVDAGLHSPGTAFVRGDTYRVTGVGTWEGRIEDGEWKDFTYAWRELTGAALDIPIWPLVGKIEQSVVTNATPENVKEKAADGSSVVINFNDDEEEEGGSGGSGSTEAINVFHEVVDNWEPAGSTTMSEWSDELGAIRLIQDIPLLDKVNPPTVTVTSIFPNGDEHPTVIDAAFPKRIKLGEWPLKVTLMDTQFHLRQQPVGSYVLPQVEGFTLMGGLLGFTLGYEQQLTYATAQACTSDAG